MARNRLTITHENDSIRLSWQKAFEVWLFHQAFIAALERETDEDDGVIRSDRII